MEISKLGKLSLILLLLVVSPTACSCKKEVAKSKYGLPVCSLSIINNKKQQIKLQVEIASKDQQRQRGLMYRKDMPENNGMLFVFNKETSLHFWMKNTYLALDIAYISKNRVINEIYSMKPLDTSITYPAEKLAQYALEVNSGWFKKHNIIPGNSIQLNGCISQ